MGQRAGRADFNSTSRLNIQRKEMIEKSQMKEFSKVQRSMKTRVRQITKVCLARLLCVSYGAFCGKESERVRLTGIYSFAICSSKYAKSNGHMSTPLCRYSCLLSCAILASASSFSS